MFSKLCVALCLVAATADVTINVISKPDGCDDPDTPKTKVNDHLKMHYTGTIDETSAAGEKKSQFDSSRTRGDPFGFQLGAVRRSPRVRVCSVLWRRLVGRAQGCGADATWRHRSATHLSFPPSHNASPSTANVRHSAVPRRIPPSPSPYRAPPCPSSPILFSSSPFSSPFPPNLIPSFSHPIRLLTCPHTSRLPPTSALDIYPPPQSPTLLFPYRARSLRAGTLASWTCASARSVS